MSINYERLERDYWRAREAAEDFALKHFDGKLVKPPVDHPFHGKFPLILDPKIPRTLREIYLRLLNRQIQAYNVFAKARGWRPSKTARLGRSKRPALLQFPTSRRWQMSFIVDDEDGSKTTKKIDLLAKFAFDPEKCELQTESVSAEPVQSVENEEKS